MRVLKRREVLLQKLIGNKTRKDLDDDLKVMLARQEEELYEAMPDNPKIRGALLIPLNTMIVYAINLNGKRIIRMFAWVGRKTNFNIYKGFAFTLIPSTLFVANVCFWNSLVMGVNPIKIMKLMRSHAQE